MDSPLTPPPGPAPRETVLRFGPDRRLTAAFALGALVAVLAAVATTDREARLLWVLAGLLLVVYVVTDLLFWPRLTVTREGLLLRCPTARARLDWHDLEHYGADVRQRLGLRSVTFEVDAGEVLVVLSRRALGADPYEVEQLTAALDPRRRSGA